MTKNAIRSQPSNFTNVLCREKEFASAVTDVLHVSQFQLKYFQFIYRYRVQAVFKKRVICGDRHPQMVYAGLKIYLRSIKSKAVEKYSSKFDSRLFKT